MHLYSPPQVRICVASSPRCCPPTSSSIIADHEGLCCATWSRLLGDLLGQVLNLLFHGPVQGLQRAPLIRGVWRQWQEPDLRWPVIASGSLLVIQIAESVSRLAASESDPHRVDHVFACGVPPLIWRSRIHRSTASQGTRIRL